MKINITIPAIGDSNDYIGLPVLDRMSCYYNIESGTPIGMITKVLELNNETVLVEVEIFDKFINIGYEKFIKSDNKERLAAVSFSISPNIVKKLENRSMAKAFVKETIEKSNLNVTKETIDEAADKIERVLDKCDEIN